MIAISSACSPFQLDNFCPDEAVKVTQNGINEIVRLLRKTTEKTPNKIQRLQVLYHLSNMRLRLDELDSKVLIFRSGVHRDLLGYFINGSDQEKKLSLQILANIAKHNIVKKDSSMIEVISAFLTYLNEDAGNYSDQVSFNLAILAFNKHNKVFLTNEGAIPLVLDLLNQNCLRKPENLFYLLANIFMCNKSDLAGIKDQALLLLKWHSNEGTDKQIRSINRSIMYLSRLNTSAL